MDRLRFAVFKMPTEHCNWQLNIAFLLPLAGCRQKHKPIRGSASCHLLAPQSLQTAPKVEAVPSAWVLNCIKEQSEFSVWLTSKERQRRPMQVSSAQPRSLLGQCLCPIRMPVWPIQQLCLYFPQDRMNIVSVKLESETDDLRSSEKEDVDLGEV